MGTTTRKRGFYAIGGGARARVMLEQLSDKSFRLLEGFEYHDGQGEVHGVTPDDKLDTDGTHWPRCCTTFRSRGYRT
jgi:hypothetical protein